jgi:hypothetical protein
MPHLQMHRLVVLCVGVHRTNVPPQRDLSAWTNGEYRSKGDRKDKPDVILQRARLRYEKELGDLDARLFKRFKTSGSQVDAALAHYATEPRVRGRSPLLAPACCRGGGGGSGLYVVLAFRRVSRAWCALSPAPLPSPTVLPPPVPRCRACPAAWVSGVSPLPGDCGGGPQV